MPKAAHLKKDDNDNKKLFDGAMSHVRKRLGYFCYQTLFASNADKLIAIILGGFSISVIWFATIDRWNFPDPIVGNLARMRYLTEVICYYLLIIIVPFCYFLAFKIRCAGCTKYGSGSYIKAKCAEGLLVSFFLWLLYRISNNDLLFISQLTPIEEKNALQLVLFGIFASISIPVILLILGGFLTKVIMHLADNCEENLEILFKKDNPANAEMPTPQV